MHQRACHTSFDLLQKRMIYDLEIAFIFVYHSFILPDIYSDFYIYGFGVKLLRVHSQHSMFHTGYLPVHCTSNPMHRF